MRGTTDKEVQTYAEYMVNVATQLGAIGNNTKAELDELLQFEISLAKVYLYNSHSLASN